MRYYRNADNEYLGGWDENPPEGAIEVASAPSQKGQEWDGTAWVDTVEMLRGPYIAEVNEVIGNIRLLYITDAPGQEMIYSAKEAEAIAFLAEDPAPTDLTPYPFIAAEVGSTASTATEVATVFSTLAAQWRAVGATLEGIRIEATSAFTNGGDVEDLTTALSDFYDALAAL